MLTATYNVAPNQWTAAIDQALVAWSQHVHGSANFNIFVHHDTPSHLLAGAQVQYASAPVGVFDGSPVSISAPQAKLQGAQTGSWDFTISINQNWDWAFGQAAEAGKYHLISVMIHEVGHALYAWSHPSRYSPYELYIDGKPGFDGTHTTNHSSIMYDSLPLGVAKSITAGDVVIAGNSGLPTSGDDVIFVTPGAVSVDGGAGDDLAIWLGTFDDFGAELINIETFMLGGSDPLTPHQEDYYKLYSAAFNRDPDLGGFTWWVESEIGVHDASHFFATSPEFYQLYGESYEDMIEALYWNVLDRAPDQSGWDYWMGQEHMGRGHALTSFALAPENTIDDYMFIA